MEHYCTKCPLTGCIHCIEIVEEITDGANHESNYNIRTDHLHKPVNWMTCKMEIDLWGIRLNYYGAACNYFTICLPAICMHQYYRIRINEAQTGVI